MKKVIALVLTLIMMFTVIAPAVSVGAIAAYNSNSIVSTIDETTDNNNEEKVSFFDKISQFFHNILAKIASVFNAKCPMCGKNHDDLDVDIDYDGTDNHIHVTVQKEVSRIEPTCGDRGSYVIASTCTICNTIVKTEVMPIPATGDHQYVVVEAVAPACTRTGWTEGEHCSVCGDVRVERKSVPALGHAWKAATCTAPKTCDRCDATEGKALGHGYTTKVTAPTCTNAGYTTYTCNACGDTYVADEVKALGHNYNVVVTAPTCTEGGYTTYTCATCGYTYVADEVEALGHSYDAVVTAPTCTDGGYTTYTCICKDTYTDDETDALDHSFTNYVSDGNATCLEDGTKTAKCDRCVVTDTIADVDSALKHSFTKYESNNDAECEKDGTKTATCDRCDATDTVTDEGSALEHVYNIIDKVDATCTEGGYTTYWCDLCETGYTRTYDALSHIDEDKNYYCDRCNDLVCDHKDCEYEVKDAKNATCTTAGFTGNKCCSRCNTIIEKGSVIEAIKHAWTVTYDFAADGKTCTATRVCANDASHNIIAEATITSTVKTPATCEGMGTTTYTATFDVEWAEAQTKDVVDIAALEHAWSVTYNFANDNKSCTATRVCANDANHNVTATATITSEETKAPTCTDKGTTTYTATFAESWAETQTKDVVNIDALAHDWKSTTYSWSTDYSECTATRECDREACNATDTATATITSEKTKAPTCTDKGTTTYTATFDVEWATTQTKAVEVAALEHVWSVTYNFAGDNKSCTATRVCANDANHNVTVEATITPTVKTPATCEGMGTTTYTATFDVDWAKAQTKDVVDIAATNHAWSVTYNFAENGKSCTATRACANDESHNAIATATITSTVKTPATCTEKGTTTYTATFDAEWATTQTKAVEDIDATGVHNFVNGKCDCGESEKVEKFATKFTGDFLYRVGNANTVAIGSLFKAKENVTNVEVTIETLNKTAASGTYTANTSDWTKGTIKFEGTGVVKVTITADNSVSCELLLEVVDATNATGAASATANNVVLLNDCDFSSLEVSGGYTLYGNGFTMTCGSDSAALDMGYSFVTLNNGTLDNVQIVCPNFDHAVLYKSNMTESGNRSETTDKTRYYNVKSGVMSTGNSKIVNSRISGARAAVNVAGGNLLIDNSNIELGAVANILVGAANSLTLRDVKLVQEPAVSTHNSSKTLMGFSVLVMCDENGNATPITLEGDLIQYAWVNETHKQYVPSAGSSIVSNVLGKTDYIHSVDGKDSVNLGIVYMPESLTSKVNSEVGLGDNRTDKNKGVAPYEFLDVLFSGATVKVYTINSLSGTDDSITQKPEFEAEQGFISPIVSFEKESEAYKVEKEISSDAEWVYVINVDMDKDSSPLNTSDIKVLYQGKELTYTVDGKEIDTITVTAGGTDYNLITNIDGKEYIVKLKVIGTETTKESPTLVAGNYEAGLCVASSYGGTWHGAAPALVGVQIRYWSVAEKQYKTIKLSDYTPTTKGKQNGTNSTWTYSPANGDFTLTLTGGQVHSSNGVYAMPVVCDGKLYFVASKSSGLVNSGNSARTIPVSYSFKDNNGGTELTFSHTWSVAENKDDQYSYSDFCNGTLTKLESSSGGNTPCVTPETLVTLADGSQVQVQHLKGDEMLLVFNHETGKLDVAPVAYIVDHNKILEEREIINLHFSDGSYLEVIGEHVFYDATLNKYVSIGADAEDYIGHKFVALDDSNKDIDNVELVKVEREVRETMVYEVVSYKHLTCFTNGILSTSAYLDKLLNVFDINPDTMSYDAEKVQNDIETYGLYTYEDFEGLIAEEAFELYNAKYLKVAIGKGYITWDDILALIDIYFDVDVQPLQ